MSESQPDPKREAAEIALIVHGTSPQRFENRLHTERDIEARLRQFQAATYRHAAAVAREAYESDQEMADYLDRLASSLEGGEQER